MNDIGAGVAPSQEVSPLSSAAGASPGADATMNTVPRETMPRLAVIAQAWQEHADLKAVFPDLQSHGIGWGEPFCFRCGWLTPTPEAAEYQGEADATIDRAWNAARGWLERAHLHDHEFGGSEEALNLVPMCPVCHEQQPFCHSREEGIAYVNGTPDFAPFVWLIRVATDDAFRGHVLRGKGDALRCLLRAHAHAATHWGKRHEL